MNNEERRDSAEPEKPVVRDRRKIDPQTGKRREPSDEGGSTPSAGQSANDVQSGASPRAGESVTGASQDAGVDDLAAVKDELATVKEEASERLEDLKRLRAEYVNYRRRVERDREAVKETAKSEVLGAFIDVLDDIGRARDHGDLTGGFRSVGESLEATTAKVGLVRYGEPGDVFDPMIHEALMHSYSDDVTETTCVQILQPGYRVGERVLRAARVAVAEPTEGLSATADDEPAEKDADEAGTED